MAVKTMEDSFVYKMLNTNNKVSNAIGKILTEGKKLDKSNLEQTLMIINKNFKFALKQQVMKAYEDGEIILMYSPSNVRLPNALPFFLTRGGNGQVVAVVAVDLYGSMNQSGDVHIDAKKLYTMMEAAYISKKYYLQNQKYITNRSVIDGCTIYANMLIKPLNKKYSLNVDRNKMHKVQFLAAKFYLMNILGLKDGDTVNNYAMSVCKNGNPILIKEVDSMMSPEDYTDISTFIQALASEKLGLGMKDLTVRGFLEAFIHMYDGATVLGLELFPYFIYTTNSVIHGAYLNNQYILEDIVENRGVKLYNVFVM